MQSLVYVAFCGFLRLYVFRSDSRLKCRTDLDIMCYLGFYKGKKWNVRGRSSKLSLKVVQGTNAVVEVRSRSGEDVCQGMQNGR
ncbi:hypothetical protein BIW11_06054 [Tropilaelaps mercedesae]|uniref:Uncharacterized protein n=1 Tax=Tropilaelaps mercedesae TaxID=418985 RepID=A0A1V9XZS1_9ACAR|nr:hypothetical protein BIW11_06054 [Tropilaelaps mercedesae]